MSKYASICLMMLLGVRLVNAQLIISGVTGSGFDADHNPVKQTNPFGWWDAGYGITTNTNGRVQVWRDISGNGFVAQNYSNSISAAVSGAQPLFTTSPATNTFNAIDFTLPNGTSAPKPLYVLGSFPAAFQGTDHPFTFTTLCISMTNATGPLAWSFTQVAGTNTLSSIKYGYVPVTGGNTMRLTWLGDTNRTNIGAATFANSQIGISNAFYGTITYDGTVMKLYANLAASGNNTPASQGVMTPDYFRFGGAIRTNFSGTDVNCQSYMIMFIAWTNALSGTDVTNNIRWLNDNRYKVF
jgi:hypothetical protein